MDVDTGGYTQDGYTQDGYTQDGYTQDGYTQDGDTELLGVFCVSETYISIFQKNISIFQKNIHPSKLRNSEKAATPKNA